MIHIKTFEDIYVPQIKKYIICKNPSNGILDDKLILCETEVYALSIKVKITTLYTYKNSKLEKIKHDDFDYVDYNNLNTTILYQSDNLEDCLERIIRIETENKYNL